MQDVLLDSVLQTVGEFHVCRSRPCVFASRAEYWVRNVLLAGGPRPARGAASASGQDAATGATSTSPASR
eukprot:13548839-Alexandrium_andersonii.AAC.1